MSKKTKLLILNNPHNPTGKCFSMQELRQITKILDNFPECLVISDEVYDFLTYNENTHIPFSTIEDNWYRTITIYSGGKLLNATGWRIGWAIGPSKLIKHGRIINNTTSYSINHPA
jgi:aspartate/methionine/tyrosine aminotransferase